MSALAPTRNSARRRTTALGLLVGLSVTASCQQGPNKHDVYMEGLQIEGDAERGPCKVHYAEGQPAAQLSGDQLAACLVRTQDALAKYAEAAKLGLDDPDFIKVHQRCKERIERLEGMIAQVRKMERGIE
ncbi:hypothetical protein [Paraliomyxa miuraensis]|uniref:hypothetical protein n=1 Tax=Paraliomyxa miuraensis TaxID=376150 RepID=UPI0022546C77|nr:hypothetical protein [Paraliomyxa miuraensis]MCX4245390.1 hypothetical protein [Paraliomyxa miuraensis]